MALDVVTAMLGNTCANKRKASGEQQVNSGDSHRRRAGPFSARPIFIRQAEAEPIAIAFYHLAFAGNAHGPLGGARPAGPEHRRFPWQMLVLAGFFLACTLRYGIHPCFTPASQAQWIGLPPNRCLSLFLVPCCWGDPTRRTWGGLTLAICGSAVVA